VSAVAFFGHSG
jgi:hypothetical protein